MARSFIAAVTVALVTLLLLVAPLHVSAADITLNAATRAWLAAWTQSIPNLQILWTNPGVCSRMAIVCDATSNTLSIRLDALSTMGFNLIGSLPEVPSSVDGSLVQVTTVSVKGKTRITGTVPASWSKLTQLTSIDVSQTKLSGKIPDELGNLPNLATVDFSNAYFCYDMPNWNRTSMASLTSANLGNNNMRGTFASSWSTFPVTTSLILKGNSLCGCVPTTWTSTNLRTAAANMNSATTSATCTRICSINELSYCPAPNLSNNGAAAQVATLSVVLVSLGITAASLLV